MDPVTTIEKKGPCRKLLTIEVPAADVSRELEKVYAKLANRARVDGFRPGKVPRKVLELRFFGEVEKEVLERIIPRALAQSIKSHGLKAVGDPILGGSALHIQEGEPLRFEVEVDLEPEFELSSYKGIKVKEREVKVTDDDVTRALEDLRQRNALYVAIENRGLKMGDYAIIDIEERPAGGKTHSRKNLALEMDDDRFIPGFCASLEGMRPGEEREFRLPIPEDHNTKQIAGTEVSFKVVLQEVKEKQLPVLDDDFARTVGDFKDMERLRESIRKRIREQKELDARREMESQIIAALVDKNKFDLPQSLVEYHSRGIFEDQKERLSSLGFELEPESQREEELRSRSRDDAVRGLAWRYIRDKIAGKESITVGDDELKERIEGIAESAKQSPAQVHAYMEKDGRLEKMREVVKGEKVLSFLLQNAKIK